MVINPVEIIIRAKDEASSIFSSMGSKVAAVGASIAAYFGINAFVGAVKGAADLEAKLSEVQAVSGATTAEMVLLRKAAEDAGSTTKFTATEGAEALGNLARSGLNAKDAIAALPAVLQLAQAGGIGLAEASEFITKATMGMGMAFSDAGRVADVLAMGANASNTSVTGLAQALSYAAPLANTLGLDLESTVAIIGKFADAGIDASRAGTALNAIMSQFADPASKFRTELAAAGITTTNFEQSLRQLAAAGPAGSSAINAVGTEAGPALRALLNQGISALDDLKAKLDSAKGSAADTAAVMQNNLKGSFDSLGSAWDTVKNTLATPVLPVLKDGVDKLSKAFSDAVSSGVVGKFGESIAVAFQAGIKWAQDFAAKIDFTQVAADLRAFADRAGEVFTQIGEHARAAGDSAKLAYGVMSAGVNAVLSGVYGLGVAFAGVAEGIQNGLALLYDGMAKITFGGISERYKQSAADMRLSAEATSAASYAMAAKAISSFTAMADGAQVARNAFTDLANSSAGAAAKSDTSAKAFDSVAASLSGAGSAATDAASKVSDSAAKQQTAALETKAKVAALRAEYEAAVATGNWQLAAEKMQALRDAAKEAQGSTAELKKKAEEDAAAIAASFERMGIKTKDQLTTFAATAKQDFERIKESGQATAEGLQSAFKKYAEAAIAANNGVASEALKSEAAMRGLQITTDNTGKSIVSAMGSGSSSVKTLTGDVNDATAALKKLGGAQSTIAKATATQFDNSFMFKMKEKLQSGKLTTADVSDVENLVAALDQNREMDNFAREMGGMGLLGLQDSSEWQTVNQQLKGFLADEGFKSRAGASKNTPAGQSTQTSQSASAATSGTTTQNHTYTVNIPNYGTVNVASASDASSLTSILEQLARAKASAG